MSDLWVPGSPFQINHPFRWHATVRERVTGKVWQYWINGSQRTPEDVAAFIAANYRNVELVTCERATRMPEKMLQPVPASHFECGARRAAEAELLGIDPDAPPEPSRPSPIVRRAVLRPIPRVSIVHRS